MSNDLHTYIEPELEARITALVLGEVGEFDVDELERIIQEQPELQIFRRRMEAMHDLLGETVKPEKDESWQLSDTRRAALRRTFSQKSEPTHRKSHIITRTLWRSAIGIAACLTISLILYFNVEMSPPQDHFTPEIVSYQAAYEGEDNFDRNEMVLLKTDLPKERIEGSPSPHGYKYSGVDTSKKARVTPKDIVWAPKSESGVAPSKSNRSYRTKEKDQVVTLEDLPQIALLSKSKKKAEKGKETSVVRHRSIQKREMTRAVMRKPSAPSSSMAKVIAANTKSNTAIPVPEIDVYDPSSDFGAGDDFGDGWGDSGSDGSGAFGSRQIAKNDDLDADAFAGEDPFSTVVDSSEKSTGTYGSGAFKFKLDEKVKMSGNLGSLDDEQRVSRRDFSIGGENKFNYPTEYEPPELSDFKAKDSSDFAKKEVARRSGTVKEAEGKLVAGRDAYSSREYKKAADSYRKALAILPPGAATEDRRKAYQSHLGDANVALAQQYRRVGKYDEARKALEERLSQDPSNFAAKKQLAYLDDPIRSNPALTAEQKQNVDEVRRNLYMGEGYYNLGKYDEAEAEMKKVLLKDPYNKSARRWLGKVAATKSDYYRAAYDHTRAHLLADVDKAWEMVLPADLPTSTSGAKVKPTIPSSKRPQPLPEETNTFAQPFSTFSLNVSDVSFKLAKVALLEKGQWPESSKVRTEEFVNAFDYGDPSPRRGESVACAIEQSAHPFLQQRNLLRIGMKTAALGRSTPLRLTVLLDNSGSMEREDREASVLAAIRVLAAQLGPQDKITLVGFARTPRLLADRISGDKAGQLVNIVANTPSEGGTNIEEALVLARQLAKRQHTDGAQDRIVLITDGVANLGNTVPDELSRQIEIMRQEGIAFDACGVGAEGLNDEILGAMTRKGDGRYYFLNRPEDADSGFAKQLAGALSPAAKNVKVQVVFNPKRVSKYRLLGFNKHRLNKEDFRNDQVDAAEMAAEEAGNAVYQIEVNPNGEGELGEVFVRFLDANTNQMVERSWPMAYESQVKPFDLTTASMQLAGVSSQLGEKLHGTDAGSVRFQNITNTLGKLRAHYQHNPKVQDLIRMCEKVK